MSEVELTYGPVGATRPAESGWDFRPAGFRVNETSRVIGRGDEAWERASYDVLTWGVKVRSGFRVERTRVEVGQDVRLTAYVGPLRVREPVRVVAVVDAPDRVGFAYGTLPGHPVSGEEAFVVSREDGGAVVLTLRSLTRAPTGPWRCAFPLALVAQRVYRRRYLRALA